MQKLRHGSGNVLIVNSINSLAISLERYVTAITSRLDSLDEKVDALEESQTSNVSKVAEKKLPTYIAKKVLPDRTLAGGIEGSNMYYDDLEDNINDNDNGTFAIYKLVKEYKL